MAILYPPGWTNSQPPAIEHEIPDRKTAVAILKCDDQAITLVPGGLGMVVLHRRQRNALASHAADPNAPDHLPNWAASLLTGRLMYGACLVLNTTEYRALYIRPPDTPVVVHSTF